MTAPVILPAAAWGEGGNQSALNVSAAAVIVPYTIRLARIVVLVSPGSGAATFNDCATTGAAAAGNVIINIPTMTAVGTVYDLNWPCLVGLTCSAAGGGAFSVSFG